MSFYGKWETYKVVYNLPADKIRGFSSKGVAFVEAGDKEYDLNFEFARHAGQYCDNIILVGKKQTEPIQAGLKDIGYDSEKLYVAADLSDAIAYMNTIAKSGSTVLFENDLPDLYNEKLI